MSNLTLEGLVFRFRRQDADADHFQHERLLRPLDHHGQGRAQSVRACSDEPRFWGADGMGYIQELIFTADRWKKFKVQTYRTAPE